MAEARLKISPPWVIYVRKLEALFDGDPGIAFNINYGAEDGPEVTLSTYDGEKAVALRKILPEEINYGGVVFHINIDCSKPLPNIAFPNNKVLYEAAFKGNPAFAYAAAPEESDDWIPVVYVVFKNCVVQFFADNLNDCHGVISTLYQDIAEEILGNSNYGVFFNTDVERGNLGKPLGEWP